MVNVMLAAALVFGAAWGALWGLTRDQNQPSWADRKPSFSGWKECGIVALGLPLALLWLATCNDGLQVAAIGAAVIWIGMGAAWSLGHLNAMGLRFAPSRDGQFESLPLVYAKLTATGTLVTLAPAGVLVWHGHIVLGLVVLLAGAFKTACYEVMYVARGLDAPRPHAGTLAAMAHGAIAVGVTGAAMVLAGG